jgi:glycosyltransferase involved in cell wall biosynthesis
MKTKQVAILHYSAPPTIGGVEAVIDAHAKLFIKKGFSVSVLAGTGELGSLDPAQFIHLPLLDSQHPRILQLSSELENGIVPVEFDAAANDIAASLDPILSHFDHLIVHNIFTKHFNLPLTAALGRLLEEGSLPDTIAWCHDLTWTSPSSRSKVFPGYPWDLLRTKLKGVSYAAVSKLRQRELAGLFDCPLDQIEVIYNGVDPQALLSLSSTGWQLVNRLDLLESDLILLMPVRVTKAKNIEYALRVLAALKNEYAKPRLVLTGPPDPHDADNMEYFRSLLELRGALGLENEMRFVYESGPDPELPYLIDSQVVGDLFRVSDVMFMPSHREGFGMPVLEAGLVGIPVVSSDVPASQEIARDDVLIFDPSQPAQETADRIRAAVEANPVSRLRSLVRTTYTWEAIIDRKIKPLLEKGGKES